MAAVQKPFSTSILAEKSGPPAWKQLPTWYQISENEHSIPPDVERMFAKQMNATTISLPSSHASLVSHPDEIAKLIERLTPTINDARLKKRSCTFLRLNFDVPFLFF